MKKIYPIKLCMLMIFALCTLTTYAQTGSISGQIIDETKLPIPGASVQVDGTQKLTVTDNIGKAVACVLGRLSLYKFVF